MANEIMTANKELAINDKKLRGFINRIEKQGTVMMKSQRAVAGILGQIESTECYKADGFESAADFAIKYYGVKKDYARKLVRIGTQYIEKDFATNLAHNADKDFTISQLSALLVAKDQTKMRELCEQGVINPDMTFKDIQEVVKTMNDALKAPETLAELAEGETAEGTDNTPSKPVTERHTFKFTVKHTADGDEIKMTVDGDDWDSEIAAQLWEELSGFVKEDC